MKSEKKLFPTVLILLVSKLQAGREVRDQYELNDWKKLFQAVIILLVSKLQAGREVRDQLPPLNDWKK